MATKKSYAESVDIYQKKINRWNEVRRILGPELCHTISTACALAAKQYREDMVASHMPETDRVSDQFHKQAKECEEIVEFLEL